MIARVDPEDEDERLHRRLRWLAEEADRLSAIELERVNAMAWADAQRNARQMRIAARYGEGAPVKMIAAEFGCSMTQASTCAKKWGVPMRLAGARWAREAAA